MLSYVSLLRLRRLEAAATEDRLLVSISLFGEVTCWATFHCFAYGGWKATATEDRLLVSISLFGEVTCWATFDCFACGGWKPPLLTSLDVVNWLLERFDDGGWKPPLRVIPFRRLLRLLLPRLRRGVPFSRGRCGLLVHPVGWTE